MLKNAIAALLFTLVALRASGQTQIQIDHGTGQLHCGTGSTEAACVATARTGDRVQITLVSVPRRLLTPKVTVNVEGADERKKIAKAFGLGQEVAAVPASSGSKVPTRVRPAASTDFKDALANLNSDIRLIAQDIASGEMADFPAHKFSFDAHLREMEAFSVTGSDGTIVDKIKKSGVPHPSADLGKWWANVQALNEEQPVLTSSPLASFELADNTQVDVEFTLNPAVQPLIDQAPEKVQINIEAVGWRITTTTGFAASGLVDDHYTVRTVVDRAASGDQAEVSHREAVREERDAANAEGTMILHLQNRGAPIPYAFSFGVGLSTGISGRLYGGLSWIFGNRGALTLGAALGKVKRISENIDLKNLGADVDPEATRRDVTEVAPFIALSWRLD